MQRPLQRVKKVPDFFRHASKMPILSLTLRDAKVPALPVARLARQGFARHSILFEAGFAPSSSPVHSGEFFHNKKVFRQTEECGKQRLPHSFLSVKKMSSYEKFPGLF